MGESKRRKMRPERSAGPRRCPDFDLAEPRKYRRDLLFERAGDDERTVQLRGFTIALALAFNDIKDVMWVNLQLHKCEPEEPPRIDTYRGQWVGMNGAFNRYAAGFMTEMGNCIKAAKEMGLLETRAFRAAEQRAAERAPFAVPAWRQLVTAFTTSDKQPDTRVARFLEHIRHNSFHYGHEHKFKELRRGYRDRFAGKVESHGGNQSAFASLGRNIWATRFYFADAAIAAFTNAKMSDCGIKGPDLEKFSKNLGTALRYILEALLIWNDPSIGLPLFSSSEWSRPGSGRAASSTVDHSDIRGSSETLAVMVVIRRELPRTRDASPGRSPVA